jgi:hypothetical protein
MSHTLQTLRKSRKKKNTIKYWSSSIFKSKVWNNDFVWQWAKYITQIGLVYLVMSQISRYINSIPHGYTANTHRSTTIAGNGSADVDKQSPRATYATLCPAIYVSYSRYYCTFATTESAVGKNVSYRTIQDLSNPDFTKRRLMLCGSLVVKALGYKPKSCGFETRWGEILNLRNSSGHTRPWGLLSHQQTQVSETLKKNNVSGEQSVGIVIGTSDQRERYKYMALHDRYCTYNSSFFTISVLIPFPVSFFYHLFFMFQLFIA